MGMQITNRSGWRVKASTGMRGETFGRHRHVWSAGSGFVSTSGVELRTEMHWGGPFQRNAYATRYRLYRSSQQHRPRVPCEQPWFTQGLSGATLPQWGMHFGGILTTKFQKLSLLNWSLYVGQGTVFIGKLQKILE